MTSWWLFSMNLADNPMKFYLVHNQTFFKAPDCFSPGVHQNSPLFRLLWASNFAIFSEFCKMCAFEVYVKSRSIIFTQTSQVVPFLSLRTVTSPWLKYWSFTRVSEKNLKISILTQKFTRKFGVIFVDLELLCFPLSCDFHKWWLYEKCLILTVLSEFKFFCWIYWICTHEAQNSGYFYVRNFEWTPGENIWYSYSWDSEVTSCVSLRLFGLIFTEIWLHEVKYLLEPTEEKCFK